MPVESLCLATLSSKRKYPEGGRENENAVLTQPLVLFDLKHDRVFV